MSGTRQRCATCGHELAETDAQVRCPACQGLLEILHARPAVTGAALRARFDGRRVPPRGAGGGAQESGVWRFLEAVLPTAASEIVSYPEGNTPLLERPTLGRWTGLPRLLLKHEGLNPTGSFKDRGMTVAVTQARRVGARALACASTGNTGASLAAYASLAGLPALVIVPQGQVALGKLTQTIAYGARTLLVRGNFDACLDLAEQARERLELYLLNSINPFRIEGQKTIVFELLQQLDWAAPDWIVLPAGNLGNTAAFGKALAEARDWGLIADTPRLAAVQAAGAAPFAASFQEGFARRHRVEPRTVASAINIGNPASYDRAVRAIRETNGVVTAVTDAEILEAKAVVDGAGVGCEPASAASVAGARQLLRDGVIGREQRVVAVLTGHLLKDPDSVTRYHQQADPRPAYANPPVEIGPTLGEVERVLRSRDAR